MRRGGEDQTRREERGKHDEEQGTVGELRRHDDRDEGRGGEGETELQMTGKKAILLYCLLLGHYST